MTTSEQARLDIEINGRAKDVEAFMLGDGFGPEPDRAYLAARLLASVVRRAVPALRVEEE